MKRHVLGAAALGLAVVGAGCANTAAESSGPATVAAGCAASQGTNLLADPSFEEGMALATGWTDESSTVGDPTYSLSTTTGVVEGEKAQRVQYSGGDGDDGTKKAEFYQGPVQGIAPGDTVRFSLCISASGAEALTKAYAIVGIESFKPDKTYISDVSTNITAVGPTPTRYTRDYTVPDGASYLAVFVHAPEFTAASSIDRYFDHASLVILDSRSS